MSLTEDISYTAGYREPNDASGDPVAKQASVQTGLAMKVTPVLAEEEQINLNGELTLTNMLGFEDHPYRDGYVYQIPVLDKTRIAMQSVRVADGQTALLLLPQAGLSGPMNEMSPTKRTVPLLILVTPTRIDIDNQVASTEPSTSEDF